MGGNGWQSSRIHILLISVTFVCFALWTKPSLKFHQKRLAAHLFNFGYNSPKNNSTHSSKNTLLAIQRLYGFTESFSWLEHIEALSEEGLLPLTKTIQRAIHEHQNPPASTCASKKFLIGGGRKDTENQGLGSLIHVAGFWLAAAIEHDRILLWHQTLGGSVFVEEGCGSGENFTNLDCIFEKLSSTCSLEHATEQNSISPIAWGPTPGVPLLSHQMPTIFVNMLKKSYPHVDFSVHGLKYWWRAQSTTYIARFNHRTRMALQQSRMDRNMHNGTLRIGGIEQKIHMPFPLPPGTIDIHVRHGDKHQEMRLIPLQDYVRAAESFVNQNPLFYRKIMFITTENPRVVEEAHSVTRMITNEGTPDNNWTIFSSNTYRDNVSPFEQLERFGRQNTTYQWLLTLIMALECDLWVGTRASNWNRIIDEIRCTWIDKCKQPYVEVGDKKDWETYWWVEKITRLKFLTNLLYCTLHPSKKSSIVDA